MATPAWVLIADDEPRIRRLVRHALEQAGHEVIEAATGDHALEQLLAHRPDVAILDVAMPGLDGLAVCRVVRTDRHLHDISLVVLSASALATRAHDAGADLFLRKPFYVREIVAVVADLLSTRAVQSRATRR
jgi:CheY-like chemotaxis protein